MHTMNSMVQKNRIKNRTISQKKEKCKMEENVYRSMKSIGVGNIVMGILVIVFGIAAGVATIVNGAKLIKRRNDLTFQLLCLKDSSDRSSRCSIQMIIVQSQSGVKPDCFCFIDLFTLFHMHKNKERFHNKQCRYHLVDKKIGGGLKCQRIHWNF